MVQAA